MNKKVAVIGGGLAGCEAARQLAKAGVQVSLFEMRPGKRSPAHRTDGLAELVCSNSLRSDEPETAIGMLKEETMALGSLVMEAAQATRVPAGKALAVDREKFSAHITERIAAEAGITLVRREVADLDDPELSGFDAVIVAAGPLASDELAGSLAKVLGGDHLYFYDAIAPIISAESVDMNVAFLGSRYKPEEKDYINCPLSEEQYHAFRAALLAADKVQPREFEKEIHFEGCLPVETLAERGDMTLAFGPMKPVGLPDPRTGREHFAIVQLRAENLEQTMFNMVGFQTKLTYPEQKRVFRMIPGLEQAEFVRLGSIHRNTYVNAPQVLTPQLELRAKPGFFLAGQMAGVEGYLESAACGLWVGLHVAGRLTGRDIPLPPPECALGALLGHLSTPAKDFQPMNVNFGLTPPLNKRAGKAKRKIMYAERARETFRSWLGALEVQAG